jgi:predicted RNA binding protein YcfA (HicA-like mRNA interferase family)
MPELRRVSGSQAVRALERLGVEQARQRGSHVMLKKETPDGSIGCVVPMHRELAIGTVRSTCDKPA